MIASYLLLALRNLQKHKVFSVISIVGLATGVAVCVLIGKYLDFESSYDKFHVNGRHIYRLIDTFYTEDVKDEYDGYDLAPALAGSLPEITAYARVHGNGSLVTFTENEKEFRYREPLMLYVDSSFLSMFSFQLVSGNPSTALSNANAIVVTQSIARKYFGNADPIGKVIQLHDGWSPGAFEITAVIQDNPENSHFDFEMLLPMQTLLQTEFYRNQNQRWDNFHTYVQLRDDVDVEKLTAKLPGFIRMYGGNDKGIDDSASLEFQKLFDIHYSPDLNNPHTGLTTIYLFGTIALFVLAIAWINYINLATARAIERAREVGVKKAIGATRRQLIIQFFVESGLINLFSVMLAVAMTFLFLPVLNNITGRSFTLNLAEPRWILVLAVLFVTGTLASGAYPAFVLSSFKTTEVIKGKIRDRHNKWSLRNGLVGFQFACSLVLLVATAVIFRQVNFMRSLDKEFETAHTVIVKGPELGEAKDALERVTSFRNELLQFPFVSKVATSFSLPGENPSISTGIRKFGLDEEKNKIGNIYWIDPYFMDLYGIRLLSGEPWNQHKPDFGTIVINEEAVKVFELGDVESAVGQLLILPFDTPRVAGVVKNHHWSSMKKPYEPMIFRAESISGANLSIQLSGEVQSALSSIENKYKAVFPGNVFSYYFLDDYYSKQYQQEESFGKLFVAFSGLAIVVGCLGLWGLAAFTSLRRQKEISIRKTLGASVSSVIVMVLRQFLVPLTIAGIIILPVCWIAGVKWLETFPYRTSISVDLLLLPFVSLLAVALITVAYQTLKVARCNPVESLKGD